MTTLANYNPLKMIKVADLEIEQPRGCIVVVGPNSSGKTLFLKDIVRYLSTGQLQGNNVCTSAAATRPPDHNAIWNDLHAKGHLKSLQNRPVLTAFNPGVKETNEVTVTAQELEQSVSSFN